MCSSNSPNYLVQRARFPSSVFSLRKCSSCLRSVPRAGSIRPPPSPARHSASVSVAQPRYRCEWLRDSPGGGHLSSVAAGNVSGPAATAAGPTTTGPSYLHIFNVPIGNNPSSRSTYSKTCMATACGLRVKDRSRSVR